MEAILPSPLVTFLSPTFMKSIKDLTVKQTVNRVNVEEAFRSGSYSCHSSDQVTVDVCFLHLTGIHSFLFISSPTLSSATVISLGFLPHHLHSSPHP